MFSFSIARPLSRCALIFGFIFSVFTVAPLRAVEDSGGYNTADPGSSIPNWTGGWPAARIDGWNYVGEVNGASGTYLGNGWVVTAAHVGPGDFTLGGVTYTFIAGSQAAVDHGNADLILFRIASPPALPPLALGQLSPVPFSATSAGNRVAMIGYGGGHGETWGLNTVTGVNVPVALLGRNTTDFNTTYGTTTIGSQSVTNDAMVVGGDSGGGNFIFNASTGKWELAGISEATGTAAFFVQISAYVQEFLDITGLAAPPVIVTGPSGVSVTSGSPISLSVTVNGSNPLTYQWLKNGIAISGATAATLTIAHASLSDSGSYSVTVTNLYGSPASSAASVTVSASVPAMPAWGFGVLTLLLFVVSGGRLAESRRRSDPGGV